MSRFGHFEVHFVKQSWLLALLKVSIFCNPSLESMKWGLLNDYKWEVFPSVLNSVAVVVSEKLFFQSVGKTLMFLLFLSFWCCHKEAHLIFQKTKSSFWQIVTSIQDKALNFQPSVVTLFSNSMSTKLKKVACDLTSLHKSAWRRGRRTVCAPPAKGSHFEAYSVSLVFLLPAHVIYWHIFSPFALCCCPYIMLNTSGNGRHSTEWPLFGGY